jgi:hypothetical protein
VLSAEAFHASVTLVESAAVERRFVGADGACVSLAGLFVVTASAAPAADWVPLVSRAFTVNE